MNTHRFHFQQGDILQRVRSAIPKEIQVYLVGGAVRDAILNRPTHDLDFAVEKNAIRLSRNVANSLKASFFPLDVQRDTGRVIWVDSLGNQQVLDFAGFRGPDLESDLRDRDFTINAMAYDLDKPEILIDPLRGANDLRNGILRSCSAHTFQKDPLRIFRCIRQAVEFGLNILPETRQLIRQSLSELSDVSQERIRDELFRSLDGPGPEMVMRALEYIGALRYMLPELEELINVNQAPPHNYDVWTHTLETVAKLRLILGVLSFKHDQELSANWHMGLVNLKIGRYRQQIHQHLMTPINSERSIKALLLLAALYHDVAKPQTREMGKDNRLHFLNHEQEGVGIISQRASKLRLSSSEIDRLKTIIGNHLRPLMLAQTGKLPSRRAIYRFFRDCGECGVDICLLSLADVLATYGPAMPEDIWEKHLDTVRSLLEAWWDQSEQVISPPTILTGRDLMREFNLQEGPLIGKLLELIREHQATGLINTRDQALEIASVELSKQQDFFTPS